MDVKWKWTYCLFHSIACKVAAIFDVAKLKLNLVCDIAVDTNIKNRSLVSTEMLAGTPIYFLYRDGPPVRVSFLGSSVLNRV